jgi:hypothetical protein
VTAPVGGLGDVLPSVCAVLGVPGVTDRLGLAVRLGDVRRVAVLLVDGLGYHLLPIAAPHAPTLSAVVAGRLGRLDELSCSFPSTTPTSLATLGTGALPGEHGVLGFTVNVPGTDRVLTHIDWRDEPDPRTWQPVVPLLQHAAATGLRAAVVGRAEYRGSGLTAAVYGTVPYVDAPDADELALRMGAELAAGPGLVFGYYAPLDTTAHLFGIDSAQWRAESAVVDRLITRLVESLPADAALLVTADHGALDVPADARLDLGTDPRLQAGVRVVAGEPRVRYLHTLPGARADVIATWQAVLGDRATINTREDAVESGWFGPVRGEHLARIGDVVVVCRDRTIVLATGHEPEIIARIVAFHGAVTPEETAIPLIAVRGS